MNSSILFLISPWRVENERGKSPIYMEREVISFKVRCSSQDAIEDQEFQWLEIMDFSYYRRTHSYFLMEGQELDSHYVQS